MRRKTTPLLMCFLLLLLVFIGTGCSAETPKEAINNEWSGEIGVKDIVSKQKTKDGTMALFTGDSVEDHDNFEYLGIALMTGQSDEGWEVTFSDVTSITNDSFNIQHRVFHYETEKGNIKELPVAFGALNNKNIATVTAEVKDEEKELDILNTGANRYFYQLNAWGPIKLLNENGEVIDRYGT
ncbi:hypothetical protein EQV77_14480 [Halobacillus fulvus]|nr:hypothetical protein EQV77_14480 [Halobacillus fulvus]